MRYIIENGHSFDLYVSKRELGDSYYFTPFSDCHDLTLDRYDQNNMLDVVNIILKYMFYNDELQQKLVEDIIKESKFSKESVLSQVLVMVDFIFKEVN